MSTVPEIFRGLSYREREIIKLRWGLGDGFTYTLEEVGHIFKVTRERIRRIEKKAISKLAARGVTREDLRTKLAPQPSEVNQMTTWPIQSDAIVVDPDIRSGVPVLAGTRFPFYMILAELVVGKDIHEIANDFDLDEDLVRQALADVAKWIGQPFVA